MLTLKAFILATVFCGFLGIILKKNLMMKIISMDVMSTGVIGFYVLVAAHSGVFTPIIDAGNTDGERAIAYADPVPQAVILTAIVIGFSIQALMLVGVMKLSRDNPTLDCQEIERNSML
ncbi:MAG: NADH-quinone oxidoreductase subunit K [Cyanobacteria bacterium J06634_6]